MKSVLLSAVTLGLLSLAGCGGDPHATAAPALPPASVTTAVATLMDHGAVDVLPGTVKAANAATIMARVPGVISRITAIPGTTVAAGAVLVELDAQEIIAKRNQAKAGVATALAAIAEAKAAAMEAAATRKLAEADLNRAQQLLAKSALTQAEFDTTEARANAAEARMKAAKAQINAATQQHLSAEAQVAEAEVMVSYTHLTAPFAGVVVRKLAEVGDLAAPGRPVIDLEDPASLRLEVEIPESLAGHLSLGTKLRVQIDAANCDLEASVSEVTPVADPINRSVLMKLALPADLKSLHSGQFGRVTLTTTVGRVLTVPTGALVRRGQLDAVFVVQGGKAHLRLVRLGEMKGEQVALRAGLTEGETVVTSGTDTLADGQAVTVR